MTSASRSSAASWLLARIGWLAAALIVALGSAGLVAALDHRPGSPARAELTWSGDQAVGTPLAAIVHDLDPLALDFDALGSQGRAALAALVASNPDALDAALNVGDTLVTKIGVETASINQRLAALPNTGPGSEGRLSSDLRIRVAMVAKAIESTSGIAEAWATLSSGSAVAARLTLVLGQHDQFSGEAVRQGSQGNYTDAVKALDQADPALAEAGGLRDRLKNTTDVTTLTQWIDRNAAIDTALRRLYTVLAVTGGKVTEEARQAFDQVKQAQQQLPPDTRALVVIMSDIARAGLNGAVIRIEQARGSLADAIAALGTQAGPAASLGPGDSGGPGDSPGPAASSPAGSGPPGSAEPGVSAPDSSAQPNVTPPDA